MIGKPTHMKLLNGATACGIVGAIYAAYDPRDCNCVRCKKTNKYKESMRSKPCDEDQCVSGKIDIFGGLPDHNSKTRRGAGHTQIDCPTCNGTGVVDNN